MEALEALGFTNIDLAADIDLSVRTLISGRIDLMPTSIKTYKKLVKDGYAVEKAMLMAGQVYGLACNKQTPQELIKGLQAELDKLILSELISPLGLTVAAGGGDGQSSRSLAQDATPITFLRDRARANGYEMIFARGAVWFGSRR